MGLQSSTHKQVVCKVCYVNAHDSKRIAVRKKKSSNVCGEFVFFQHTLRNTDDTDTAGFVCYWVVLIHSFMSFQGGGMENKKNIYPACFVHSSGSVSLVKHMVTVKTGVSSLWQHFQWSSTDSLLQTKNKPRQPCAPAPASDTGQALHMVAVSAGWPIMCYFNPSTPLEFITHSKEHQVSTSVL